MTEFTRYGSPGERRKTLLSLQTTHAAAHGMSNGIGSTFEFTWLGGALFATIRGVILLDDTRAFRQALIAELDQRLAVKVLIDMREATLMIGEANRERMTTEAIATPISAPVGYVVAPAQWQAMFDHCMGIAETGRMRLMFSDFSRALRWAELQALLPQLHPQAAAPVAAAWAEDR